MREKVRVPPQSIPVVFFIIFAIALLYNLWGGSLVNSDDPIYASMAREAYETGEFLELKYQGELLFEKPPVLFWTIAGFFALFGINDFSARLPDALFALALLVVVYLFVRRDRKDAKADCRTGVSQNSSVKTGRASDLQDQAACIGPLVACIVLLSSGLFYFNARRVMTDMPFWFFTLTFFLLVSSNGGLVRRCLAGLAAGLAIMTKGPAFGPPFAAALLWFLATAQHRKWSFKELAAFGGMAVMVAGWWHAYQLLAHGSDFAGSYLGYHAVSRMTTALVGSSGPEFYLELLLEREGLLHTVLFVAGVASAPVLAWMTRKGRDMLLACFAVLYAVLIVMMKTRLPHYLLPELVVGAICLGRLAEICVRKVKAGWCEWVFLGVVVVAGCASFAIHNSYHLFSGEYSQGYRELSAAASKHPSPLVAFNDYNVAANWYADRHVRLWSTDKQLCRHMEAIDMLVRIEFAWCPADVSEFSAAIGERKPVFITRGSQVDELEALIAASGLPPGSYRLVRSTPLVAFFPQIPQRP